MKGANDTLFDRLKKNLTHTMAAGRDEYPRTVQKDYKMFVQTANIENPTAIKADVEEALETIQYPLSATLNPLGSVLVGSHPDSTLTDKRVKLEIIYSSYE